MKYHIDPRKKTNWWTHSTFTFFTTFYFISSLEAQQKTCISFEENTNWDTFLPQDTGLHICGGKSVKLEPRTKTLHDFSDAALSHSQFCYKDNFQRKMWKRNKTLLKNVSPHPLRWGLFGSCPLALWRRSLLEKWQYLCPLLFTGQYLCFLENNPHLTCNIHRDKPPSNPLENEKLIPNVFASVELWEFENEFYCYLNVFDPLRKVFHFIRCLWSLKASFCISNNSQ